LNRRFFTDRDLGKRFPEILSAAGLIIESHHDLFPPDGADEQWLEYCGQNEYIAITHDQNIRYRPNELEAVKRHRVSLLIVIGKVSFAKLAENFVVSIPKIERFLDTYQPPLIAKIYRPSPSDLTRKADAAGTIVLWYPRNGDDFANLTSSVRPMRGKMKR
jgi:PIN like domain